ncbi:nucleoside 2-deoxyribosyltransferase domain-containing protein [Flammeovirgaceae bacterium SG7u.111]|nr:nucleoside 2-deoxyribosyltransferase domain-containing protein [Flammeovirgaceae bacterium SG7u.132]WPO34290.1 nucleoside 2-deoxyribosyltransferase domain-containing protein [Flammeovirgaceae bacterium SG7u.111]
MAKVFLGGTANKSRWRNYVIPRLQIEYFNPVVDNWDEEAYKKELVERENCDYCLYVITPKMTGVYSIAEVIDDSNKRPGKTVFCALVKDEEARFSEAQIKSMIAVGRMVEANGGKWFKSLQKTIEFLNNGLHKD